MFRLMQLSPYALSRLRNAGAGGYTAIADAVGASTLRDRLPPDLTMPELASLKPVEHDQPPIPITDSMQYGLFTNVVLNVGTADSLVLPAPQAGSIRIALVIINTHATQTIFIRFGGAADALIGFPLFGQGTAIGFDKVVPQDDIHIIGSAAATTGVLLYSNKNINQAG